MSFYTNIFEQYDRLFPLQNPQVEFVIKNSKRLQNKPYILDIGCGTASLAVQLARKGYAVSAFDGNNEMIIKAKKKKQDLYPYKYPILKVGNMNNFKDNYSNEGINIVLCFGNTLVHLDSKISIANFIKEVSNLLPIGGIFLLQILNYENIISNRITSLPTVGDENIFMERKYVFRKDGFIDFNTCLMNQTSGEKIKSSIPLIPLKRQELIEILENENFGNINTYGNFAMKTLSEDSIPLVISCEKMK